MQTFIFQGSSDTMLIFYQVNVVLHLTLIRSLKDKQSQKREHFILGNPIGEENPAELLYYRFNQVQCQDEDLSPRRIKPTEIAPSINQQINPPYLSSSSAQCPRSVAHLL